MPAKRGAAGFFLAAAAFALASAGARRAWCAPLAAALFVERGPGSEDCPGPSAIRTRVESIMGRPLGALAVTEAGLEVTVDFARDGERYRALLRTRGPKPGERLLEDDGPTCVALAEAVGVTLALLLDREPPPQARAATLAGPPPSLAPRRSTGWLGIASGPVFGATPGVSLGFGLALGLELERWSLELGGGQTLARSTAFASGNVRVGLSSGYLQLCRMIDLPGQGLRAGACARAAAGWLEGEGDGYPRVASAGMPWLAGGGGVRVGGPWGRRLMWGVSGVLLFPARRQTFSIQNAGVAYQSSLVGGSLSLELGVRAF